MARVVGIGNQSLNQYEKTLLYRQNSIYIKGKNEDIVTLITRLIPFWKNIEYGYAQMFFSNEYKDRGEL